MKCTDWKLHGVWTLAFAVMLVANQAAADKPSRNDGDQGKRNGHSEQTDKKSGKKSTKKSGNNDGGHQDDDRLSSRDNRQERIKTGEYFSDRHRTVTHDYYSEQFRKGHCPPGLAKKGNGCMPPGQAKKWAVGRPLPRDVIYHDVPQALVIQLERPSAGYRYVRVATDILLIAIGTGMVVDAIQDIGRQ